MEASSPRPVLLYDGDCAFCSRWVDSWREATRGAVDFVPVSAGAPPAKEGGAVERPLESVEFLRPEGSRTRGARAVFEALAQGGHRWALRLYGKLPGFAPASEAVYRFVARHRRAAATADAWLFESRGRRKRPALSRFDALLIAAAAYPAACASALALSAAGAARAIRRSRSPARRRALRLATLLASGRLRPRARGGDELPRWVFLRLLGVVYLAAFASLLVQARGLLGDTGILPARAYLDYLRRLEGRRGALLLAPTVLWLAPGGRSLRAMCLLGMVLSCLLLAGVAPIPVLAALWALYLSLNVAAQTFLEFQWDALLLEAGFLATFYAPPGLWPRLGREPPPSRAVTWMLRWLLFRVLFSSGVAKIVSGDRSWRAATALQHHFQTQPLPTRVSYYAHQLSPRVLRLCVYGVWLTEVALPPLGLFTRRMRQAAFASTLLLQATIALTGNYGFFNLLTAALAVPLLDDAAFPRALRRRLRAPTRREGPWPPDLVAVPAAAALAALGAVPFAHSLNLRAPWPRPLLRLYGRLAPFHWANAYGLFAVMTTRRPEIIVEGSDDGRAWKAYEFRWKPGDPKRPPRFTGLHMPRLDWQMWFAALSPTSQQDWLLAFLEALLDGRPDVRRLLGTDPFPDEPPRAVRARVFAYRFTTRAERRATGAWWERQYLYELVPSISLPSRAAPNPPPPGAAAPSEGGDVDAPAP